MSDLLDCPIQERTFCFEPALYHELQVICQNKNATGAIDDYYNSVRQGVEYFNRTPR